MKEIIGIRVRQELVRLHLNLTEASKLIGEHSLYALSNVCKGNTNLTAEMLAKLKKIGVDEHFVLTGETERSSSIENEIIESNQTKEFGKRIKDELMRLELTNKKATELIGYKSPQLLSNVCVGRTNASAELLQKLHSIGMDLNYIITGIRAMEKPIIAQESNQEFNINYEEKLLVQEYRKANLKEKNIIKAVLDTQNDQQQKSG